MARLTAREAIAPGDLAWLRMDRAKSVKAIIAILRLAGPVDIAALTALLGARIGIFPRLRQFAVVGSSGAWWEDDPAFALADHVRSLSLPRAAGEAELRRAAARLAARPFARGHPLWEMHVVEHVVAADGRSGGALLFRLHHSIADGNALRAMLSAFSDPAADGGRTVARTRPPPAAASRDGWVEVAKFGGLHLLYDPAEAPAIGALLRDGRRDIARLIAPADAVGMARRSNGRGKVLNWVAPVPLDGVRRAGRALGCSVHDLCVAALAGGLRQVLAERREAIEDVRFAMPMPLDSAGPRRDAANRFGMATVALPAATPHRLARLYETQRRIAEMRGGLVPKLSQALFWLAGSSRGGMASAVADLLSERVAGVVTMIAGPRGPRYIAGRRVEAILAGVGQAGGVGMRLTLVTYAGALHIGLFSDTAAVPEPLALLTHLREELLLLCDAAGAA